MVAPAILAAIPTVLEIGGRLIDKIFPQAPVWEQWHILGAQDSLRQG